MLKSKIINKKIIIFFLFYFIGLNNIYSDNLEYKKAKDAIISGNVSQLLKYFQNGLNPFLDNEKNNKNIFHIALESGNIEIIELFIIQNIDLNYNYSQIGYPLYFASEQNNEKLVKVLLDYGADPFIMEIKVMKILVISLVKQYIMGITYFSRHV